MKSLALPIGLCCLIAVTFYCCTQSPIDKSKEEYEKFNNFIEGYSQSPMSRCENLYVDLSFAIEPNLALPSDLFEITPDIGGTYQLSGSRKRIYLVNADIKHNVSYSVKFNIGKLKEMPDGMGSFTFPLEAEKQSWDIILSPPVNNSMEFVTYTGQVKFGVCEPKPEVLNASLKALQDNKELPITWSHKNTASGNSEFTIRNIKRADKLETVDLILSMEALNVSDEATLQLAIPSKSDFSFHSSRIQNSWNKKLELIFTDPLLKDQNLSGLVEVKGRTIDQIKIIGNTVEVFFKNENYGYFDLKIRPGIKNLAGFPLKDSYEKELFYAPPTPSVKIAERGNILPPGDGWDLPVSLVSATGFRLRILKVYDQNVHRLYQENANPYVSQQGLENIGRIELDTTFSFEKEHPFHESYHAIALDRLVEKEKGALYKIILTIPKEKNSYPCQEWRGSEGRDLVDRTDFDRPWMSMGYDYEYYEEDYYYGNHNGNEGHNYYAEDYNNSQGSPCDNYFTFQIQDARLLMCTDIGVVAKSEMDKGSYFFYLSQITSAAPISNAEVELFNVQGRPIAKGYSDGNGLVTISTKDAIPFMAKASYNNQYTYLPLQDAKALSLSTFQVEGKNWIGAQKVFFYGDRDVWRPGDTIYMQSLVFSPDKTLPAALPVSLKLYDPTNRLVKEWTVSNNQNGIYDCRFSSELNDPTGNWRMEMKLGGKAYKTPVRIETIRPNRLKMQMNFADEKLIKKAASKAAPITVKWMHGLEAKDLMTEVTMLQRSLKNPFGADYQNYVFDDIKKQYDRDRGMVISGATNNSGVLDFSIPTAKDESYPSMMLFNFQLRVFEKGGAFSNDMKAIKYSPYTHYIGAKFPGGDNGSEIYVKDDEAIMLAALNEDGRPENRSVTVTLTEINNNWWYQFGNKGNYAALSNSIGKQVNQFDVTVGKEGKSISFKNYGRLLVRIEDKESGHSISRIIYSYGDGWNDSNEEVSQLEVLPFLIEQTDYEVGDNLQFDLPPMGTGRYLITIETGGRIVHKEVRRTSGQPSEVYIPITSEMAPTAYVHVHLIQAWSQHENDRPLRLFGVKPIKVYDPNTILQPKIRMPDALKTDETFAVSINEEQGKAMSYTLAIVDEGLLDITQFKTPDPWSAFFGKERLNVKTWDMYREIFQRFLGEYTSLLAIGGDGANAIKPTAKARRFKPVVKFVGPFTLGAGETKTHDFQITNYVGSVRAMVVATDSKAIGRHEKTVPVKKPLMLYATLPRVLGPQEKIKVPVTVFSMDEGIKEVKAKIITDDKVKVIGEATQTVMFDKEGEKDIAFELESIEGTGVVKVSVEVQSGKHYFKEDIELDLRPSSAFISKSYHNLVGAGQAKDIPFDLIGMAGTQSAEFSVSKGLNFSFAPQVDWLSNYPHGCLEQTVSSIFPQIYLYQMNLLDNGDQMKYRQQFAAAIQKLRYLQRPDGGFSYWPGGNTANSWGTSYAFQFLLEAKKLGYEVPEDMIKKCISYQYKSAGNTVISSNNNTRRSSDYSTIGQAYKLYTLAQAGKPNFSAMNRLRLVPSLHNTAKWILAHSFIILGEDDLADLMIKSASDKTDDYREQAGTFGSRLRDQAMIARVLIDKGDKVMAKRLIDDMVQTFNADEFNRLSTQERAQSLITFAKFVSSLGTVEDSITYDLALSTTKVMKDQLIGTQPDNYDLDATALQESKVILTNKGNAELYSTLVVKGQPLRDESAAESQDLKLKVEYFSDAGNTIDPQKIAKGSDFIIQYTVIHEGKRDNYENMALTAIFPSGWEILNQRMDENSTFNSGDVADYQDIRDDRVYLYFDIERGKQKVFRFKMNATYEGKYWAPPAFCEAMYDASIRAKERGYWAEVR